MPILSRPPTLRRVLAGAGNATTTHPPYDWPDRLGRAAAERRGDLSFSRTLATWRCPCRYDRSSWDWRAYRQPANTTLPGEEFRATLVGAVASCPPDPR